MNQIPLDRKSAIALKFKSASDRPLEQREAIEGVVSQVFQARRGKTPRNNQAQNGQFEDAVKEIEKRIGRQLKKDEIRRLHEAISGEGYGFHDIVSIGVAMFGKPEDRSEDDEDYDARSRFKINL